jgi:hypothetical protein
MNLAQTVALDDRGVVFFRGDCCCESTRGVIDLEHLPVLAMKPVSDSARGRDPEKRRAYLKKYYASVERERRMAQRAKRANHLDPLARPATRVKTTQTED